MRIHRNISSKYFFCISRYFSGLVLSDVSIFGSSHIKPIKYKEIVIFLFLTDAISNNLCRDKLNDIGQKLGDLWKGLNDDLGDMR